MNWQLRQKLTGNSANSEYGRRVATNADGSVLMMGGYRDDPNGVVDAGGALIYTGNAAVGWTLKQRLTGDTAGDQFGISISTNADGSVLMMGGYRDDPNGVVDAGGALIYTGNAAVGWTLKQRLTGDTAGDQFGISISTNADGSVLMMGGYRDDPNGVVDAGGALVYTGSTTAGWQLRQKLTGNKPNGFFGFSTAINSDGTVLMMGGYDSINFNRGTALVYTGNAIVGWQLGQILTGDSFQGYGHNVAMNANGTILMMRGFIEDFDGGGDGSIYVYTGNAINKWQFRQKLTGDSIGYNYGDNVATNADGNIIMMGGYRQDYNGLEVIVYTGNATAGWQLNQKLTNDNFGDSVATNNDGTILLVGGKLDNNATGAALIYSLSTPILTWSRITNVGRNICTPQSSNCFKITNVGRNICTPNLENCIKISRIRRIPPPPLTWNIEIKVDQQFLNINNGIFGITLNGTGPNITIDWGDGSLPQNYTTTGLKTKNYNLIGFYTIKISGSFLANGNIQLGTSVGNKQFIRSTSIIPHIPGLTDFTSTFALCSNLAPIPEYLLYYNPNITNFLNCFAGIISMTSIPENLFVNNKIATNFQACFQNVSISSIPGNLFANNTLATNFAACFADCYSLSFIPANLFTNNTLATNFVACFAQAFALSSVPASLFSTNLNAIFFERCFVFCNSLTNIPATLFANNLAVIEFINCFGGVPLTTTSYSNLLINLASNAALRQNNVEFGASISRYNSSAQAAVNVLTNKGWIFDDLGLE